MHGKGRCAWPGGGERAWQERRPLQWTVHMLLECILVDDGLTMMVMNPLFI